MVSTATRKRRVASYIGAGIIPGEGGGVVPPSELPHMKDMIASVVSGAPGARARWGFVGDSTGATGIDGAGGGSGGGGLVSPRPKRALSIVDKMAAILSVKGIPTRKDSVWASATPGTLTTAGYSNYNPNLVFTGTWTLPNNSAIGGRMFQLSASQAGTATFTPEENTNRLDFMWLNGPGQGTITVSDSSGILATIDQQSTVFAYQQMTISRAANSKDPFIVQRAAGGTNLTGACFVCDFVPWSSVTPMVELWNMGWIGSTVANQASTSQPYSPGSQFKTIVADMWSINLGANDANGGVADATYQANLEALLPLLGTVGTPDKLLIEPHPATPTSNSYNIPAGYRAAIQAVAANHGFKTPPSMADAGLVAADYYDSIHLVTTGTTKEAVWLYAAVHADLGLPA